MTILKHITYILLKYLYYYLQYKHINTEYLKYLNNTLTI